MSAEGEIPLATVTRPAMGAAATITTDAPGEAIVDAHELVARLERRWTRFCPESELNRANRASGAVIVDPVTAGAVAVTLAAHAYTDGWFDPTLGRELAAAGYRRSFADGWQAAGPAPRRAAGATAVVADPVTGLVDVPDGIDLDLGGIGKGMAADLVADRLIETGASVVSVEIGGDVRVRSDRRVVIEIPSPDGTEPSARIGLRDGGIAMSGPTHRRAPDGRHHLIDPRTGRSAEGARVVVVVAAFASGAEILATAAAVAPLADAVSVLDGTGATGWLVEPDGSIAVVGDQALFLEESGWLTTRSGSCRREPHGAGPKGPPEGER